jgi:class 3 adenylate cyclase
MLTQLNQLSRKIELGYKGLIRRRMVANGTASEDDRREWLKASTSGHWVRPTSHSILYGDLKRFQDLSASKHVEFHRMLEHLYAWSAGMAGGSPLSGSFWGDAILGIFSSPSQAAAFSLAFKEAAATVNWRYFGLAEGSGFRLGLHQGLLQRHEDKILNQHVYVGASVTFSARIQQAALPGKEILTSKAFAKLLNASGDPRYECRSVGNRLLPKINVLCPAFELRRKPCTV